MFTLNCRGSKIELNKETVEKLPLCQMLLKRNTTEANLDYRADDVHNFLDGVRDGAPLSSTSLRLADYFMVEIKKDAEKKKVEEVKKEEFYNQDINDGRINKYGPYVAYITWEEGTVSANYFVKKYKYELFFNNQSISTFEYTYKKARGIYNVTWDVIHGHGLKNLDENIRALITALKN